MLDTITELTLAINHVSRFHTLLTNLQIVYNFTQRIFFNFKTIGTTHRGLISSLTRLAESPVIIYR